MTEYKIQRNISSVYLDAGAQGNTATSMLTFSTGTNTANRMFDIKVTQLPCNSILL